MADDLDFAAELQDREREAAIARRVRYVGESATDCVECGEAIPMRRREAIRGTQYCVECAERAERRIA